MKINNPNIPKVFHNQECGYYIKINDIANQKQIIEGWCVADIDNNDNIINPFLSFIESNGVCKEQLDKYFYGLGEKQKYYPDSVYRIKLEKVQIINE